jgi:hypothetical protein
MDIPVRLIFFRASHFWMRRQRPSSVNKGQLSSKRTWRVEAFVTAIQHRAEAVRNIQMGGNHYQSPEHFQIEPCSFGLPAKKQKELYL